MLETILSIDTEISEFLALILTPFTFYAYAIIAFSILLGLGFHSIIVMSKQAKVIGKELNEAKRILADSDNEELFSKNFPEINSGLSKLPLLGHHWKEFVETLIPPLDQIDDEQYTVFRNTLRPDVFFKDAHITHLIKPKWRPETLIGFGLLLTFIGFVAALVEAGPAFAQSGGANNIKAALATLISTAGSKFVASIGGLLGALITSGTQSRLRHKIGSSLSGLCKDLEDRLLYASVERISADQYGHMQRQTKNLERLGNEIAIAISDRIEHAITQMPTMLGEAIQPISNSIDMLKDTVMEGNKEGLGQLVKEFKTELTGAGEASMNQVINQLDGLSSLLGETVKSLSDTTENLKTALTSSANEAATNLQDSSQIFSTNLTNSIQALLEGQAGVKETIENFFTKLHEGSAQFDTKLQSVRDNAANEMAESLKMMNQQISKSTLSVNEAWQTKVNEMVAQGAEKTAESIGNWSTQITQRLEAPIGEITSGLTQWAEKTSQVSQTLQKMNSQLEANQKAISIANSSVNESVNRINQSSQALLNASQPLKAVAESAINSTQALSKATEINNQNSIQLIPHLLFLINFKIREERFCARLGTLGKTA